MGTRGGTVYGADHAHGGVKLPVTVMIEEEGGEVNIPRELLSDDKVHNFRGTNKKILDRILKLAGLSVSDKVTDVRYGDVVICRRSAEDRTPRILTGTVEQLLDQINQSNGCRPIGNMQMAVGKKQPIKGKNGGRIPLHQKLKDWQIENPNSPRWQKKKERIQQLSSTIQRLRTNVSRDLASEDERMALTALVIAVMDRTAERVGNDDSADNGHFGVTGFRKKHISVIGNTVHLDYVGKSGTRHEKSFTDERIAKALKKAIKSSPSKFLFETSGGFRIKSDKVSRYLDEFGISPKDIRGYQANRWMVEKLERQNSKVKSDQPDKAKKERKKIFNQALKETAAAVGHGRGTLKKHYMIPELPVEFIEHGRIIDMRNLGYYKEGGMIPERYKDMGFSKVGQKKRSTRPKKKWMVLARKGDRYKVVHGGEKGMEDFSQHRDKTRQARFWNRMGGFDSEKANDPFSPLYWHKKFGTWENGGVLDEGTLKVAWVNKQDPEVMESKMYEDLDTALAEAKGKTFMVMELEDSGGDYYKWRMLPYGEYEKFQGLLSLNGILFENGGEIGNDKRESLSKYKEGGKMTKPSNLTGEQQKFVRTKEFKDWFGDWEENPDDASVMLDENREPKIFYHGSNKSFDKFDKKQIGSGTDPGWLGHGFYFYGVEREAMFYGNVKEYFLNIRNPYYATYEENERLAELNDKQASKEFSDNLIGEGYDGVYFNGNLREETVVFEPDQIMAAPMDNSKYQSGGIIKKECTCFHSYLNQNYSKLCNRLAEENINEIPELRAQVTEAYEKYQSIKSTS